MRWGRVLIVVGVSGVTLGVSAGPAAWLPIAVAIAIASLLVLRPAARVRAPVLLGVFAAATTHGTLARERALAPSLVRWFEAVQRDDARAGPVQLEGVLAGDAVPTPEGARILIRAEAIVDDTGRRSVSGLVQTHVSGAMVAQHLTRWRDGRRIRAPVSLRAPPLVLNPGLPSPTLQAIRRPFDLSGAIKSASLVEIERGSWVSEGAAALRASVRRSLDSFVGARSPVSAAIVKAILIGDRSGLDPEVERRLQIAGTYHVVAISGGNIALLLAVVLGGLRLTWRSATGTSLAAMAVVCAYGWIAGGDPSVVRAVSAACVYLGLGLAGHTASPIDVLLVVAGGMAALDPRSTVDVGTWLSFGATLGILLAARHVMRWLQGPIPPVGRVGRYFRTAVVGLFACTVAAEWSLLPISARVFGRVGIAGLVVNFIAIPAMAVVQIAGLATCSLAPVWTGGAAWAGAIAAEGAHLLVSSASLVDFAPWASWRVPPGWMGWTLIFYASSLGIVILRGGVWRRALTAALAVSTLMIVWAPETGLARPRAPWLRLTALDVGQGDALLLQFPTGEAMTIDSGGGPGAFDVGDRVVTPAVWALGERRLTWLAVTHDDGDHIGGAASLTSNFRPREIWEGVPVVVNAEWQHWRATARSTAAIWRSLQTGDRIEVGPVTIDVRNPPLPDWERRRVRNDDSLVLLVRYGDVDLLLAGDVGADVEAGLLTGVEPGSLRVLKIAHHGSRTSTSPALLTAFRPQVALVSAGRGNLFGHPAPDVLARLIDSGAQVYRTDQDGAVIVETDGREVRVQTTTGRRWTWRLTKLPS